MARFPRSSNRSWPQVLLGAPLSVLLLALGLLWAGCSPVSPHPDAGAGGGGGGGGAGGGGGGGGGGDGGGGSCLASSLLQPLGKEHLLVGAQMEDDVAAQAPFDLRYIYLAGGLFDGSAPCASCATGCTSQGSSCSNQAGCNWWGCWQYDQVPPGDYARQHLQKSQARGQLPMFTYYVFLQASGVGEGASEVTQANDGAFMTRYFADWRFLLQQIGTQTAFLHLEPDFWGYAQQLGPDPHQLPAAVASANPTDCAGQENSIAGMGRCLIAMVRKYAPNAKVGLHASAWASGPDAMKNADPSLDVVAEAKKVAGFLEQCGAAEGDFVVVEASDRDAGYYESIGRSGSWDATNATLPSFTQAFRWAKALAETIGRPLVWWQLPVGNPSLPNTTQRWQDNRLDYFFDHPGEVVASHGAAIAFGAGAADQTNPSTDDGHLVARVRAYANAPQPVCP